MSVKVNEEVFILPLNAVMESLQPQAEDLHPMAGGERMLQVRGEYLPLVELYRVFDVAGAKNRGHSGHRGDSAKRRPPLCAAGGSTDRPAPVVVKKPGKQLPQSAGNFRGDDPRRRQRGADRRRVGAANAQSGKKLLSAAAA